MSRLTFLALLLNNLGLLTGLVALLEVQCARPQISIRVAFRPLTLYVSARRRAAGCCVSRCETSIETIERNVDQANKERETFKDDRELLNYAVCICVQCIHRQSVFDYPRSNNCNFIEE